MVTDTVYLINEAIQGNKNVLVEGANAVMLDYDLGESRGRHVINFL